MKTWKELTLLQKILIGLLVISLVSLIPESAFLLLDAGGIDIMLLILFVYSQNIKLWFDAHFGVVHYPTIDHRTFITHSTVSSLFLWMTGSVVLAYGFFLVLMFMRGA